MRGLRSRDKKFVETFFLHFQSVEFFRFAYNDETRALERQPRRHVESGRTPVERVNPFRVAFGGSDCRLPLLFLGKHRSAIGRARASGHVTARQKRRDWPSLPPLPLSRTSRRA